MAWRQLAASAKPCRARDIDSDAAFFRSTGARYRRTGVRAYIMKSDADKDLVSAVEALSNHRSFFTSRAADMLLDGFHGRTRLLIRIHCCAAG